MAEFTGSDAAQSSFDLAVLSDAGTDRPDNEDACGCFIESPEAALAVVADGIGGYEGGEIASRMAVDVTLEAYRRSPPAWGAAKRLYRAVQRANIEIHYRAIAVPALRRMGTTLTAAVIEGGRLSAAHVGDCRLYLARRGRISQITKDHTVVAEHVRMGLMTAARARNHPERSMLSRSIGHELIVSVGRFSMPLIKGDRVLVCSVQHARRARTRARAALRRRGHGLQGADRGGQRARQCRQPDRRGFHDERRDAVRRERRRGVARMAREAF
jgi:serine/threonine protein phosphatase PrpC